MKTFPTTLPLAALAVLMSLGPAAETSAQSIFGEAPPATATVAWDAERLVLRSPPPVQDLRNGVQLEFSGTGTARHGSRCNKSYDIASLNRVGKTGRHGVTLNGSSVSMPIRICGPHAVGKSFRVAWRGNARSPAQQTGRYADGSRGIGHTFGTRLTSFGAGPNCAFTHMQTRGSGFNKRTRPGSINCWTVVTITN